MVANSKASFSSQFCVEIKDNLPCEFFFLIQEVSRSSHDDAMLAEDNAIHLLCVKFRFCYA